MKSSNLMIIGFDAKRVFHNASGLGNYSRDLVSMVGEKLSESVLYLYNPKPKSIDRFHFLENTFEKLPQKRVWKALSSLWRQKAMLKDLENDEVVLYHGLSGELPMGIEKTNIKSVVTIHDLIFERYPELYSKIDRQIHFKKFKRAAHAADVVIAISEQTKRDIIDYLGVPASKIKVVYQGCHKAFKKRYSIEQKKEVIEKYNLPNEFILNVGTIEDRKNVLTLIKAIENTNYNLVIVGRKRGAYADRVVEYVKSHQMENRVYFIEGGTMEELAMLYQLANLFVYPSYFEGFGIPIIEALFSKTPVISSKGGCFSEAGGEGSVYTTPGNVEELHIEIKNILASEVIQNAMIEQGYQHVQKFQDAIITKEVIAVYSEVLGKSIA